MPAAKEIHMKTISIVLASLVLAACAVGPDYKPPVDAPGTLINARSTGDAPLAAQSPDGLWWQQFDDPTLNSLITRALAANLDLRIAVDRVRAARAVFSGAQLDYGPHVPLTAGYAHSNEQEPGFGSDRIDARSYSRL